MSDLLLTHGYFLYEDPKEMQILKPYVPLGLLYICSYLRAKGFDVDVFDTTFSSMEELKRHLQTERPIGARNLRESDDAQESCRDSSKPRGWLVGRPLSVARNQEHISANISRLGRMSWFWAKARPRWRNFFPPCKVQVRLGITKHFRNCFSG